MSEKTTNKKAIGIDLGTTNSCVAYYENNTANVIKNRSGNRTTPSVVSFDHDGSIKVGEIAKRQLLVNSERTVYSIKRLMGTKEKVKILNKEYTPEDISAYILMELKKQASEYLGYDVTEAVITVPAYFTEVQRQATKDAGKIAGLNVLRLVNEPTAAALSYKLDANKNDSSIILVYDLGGGTFDVSILKVENGIFEVISTSGDRNLGGDDFDRVIFDWAIERIKNQSGIDVKKSPEMTQRVRLESERVKKELSFSENAEFYLPHLSDKFSFSDRISRPLFENLVKNLIEKTKIPLKTALNDSKLSTSQINSILLVGGSTRMPCVQKLIKDMFNKEPVISIDPDESVALGASIQAGIVKGQNNSGLLLMDVTPLSLGIEESGNLMSVIIPRNTTIPVKKEQEYTNAEDNQTKADIRIFQGERKLSSDNELLGEFSVELKPSKRGQQRIVVTFELDVNGLLKVTAYDSILNKPNKIDIVRNNLPKEEIEKKIKQAEEFKEKDEEETKKIKLNNILENIRYKISDLRNQDTCSEEDKNKINKIEKSINDSGWYKKDDFDISSYNEIEKKLIDYDKDLINIQIKIDKEKHESSSKNSEKQENNQNSNDEKVPSNK